MSMKVSQSQLDRFDWERGDVLSIAKEDAARLAELPVEMFSPPFHALLRWFLGEDEKAVSASLEDPRDKGLLRGLIEHQKVNAQRRGDFLMSQKEKSEKAKEIRDSARVPRKSHGNPTEVPSIRESESISRSVSDKAYASLRDNPPTAFDASLGGLRTVSQMGAKLEPIVIYDKPINGQVTIKKIIQADDVRSDTIGFLANSFGKMEKNPEKFRGALHKYRTTLGGEVFFDIVWGFLKDYSIVWNMYVEVATTEPDSASTKKYKCFCENAGKTLFIKFNNKKADLGLT